MARGGVNKAVVQIARTAILARGEHPSIDAVRIEMGNTGSKTTIHRYLKELDEVDTRRGAPQEQIGDELSELVARLARRLQEQAQEPIDRAQAHVRVFEHQVQRGLQTGEHQFEFVGRVAQRRREAEDVVAECAEDQLLLVRGGGDPLVQFERRVELLFGVLVGHQFQRAEQAAAAGVAYQRMLEQRAQTRFEARRLRLAVGQQAAFVIQAQYFQADGGADRARC